MKTRSVDLDELTTAMEDSGSENVYYLDLTTGDVVLSADEMLTGEEPAEDYDENPDRYLPVEPVSSEEAYEIMERFVAGLAQNKEAARLSKALSGPHPFRRFKDEIAGCEELKKMWFDFHDAEMEKLAIEWLEYNGIKLKPSAKNRS